MPQRPDSPEDQALVAFLNLVDFLAHWNTEARLQLIAGDAEAARNTLKGAEAVLKELLKLYGELMHRG